MVFCWNGIKWIHPIWNPAWFRSALIFIPGKKLEACLILRLKSMKASSGLILSQVTGPCSLLLPFAEMGNNSQSKMFPASAAWVRSMLIRWSSATKKDSLHHSWLLIQVETPGFVVPSSIDQLHANQLWTWSRNLDSYLGICSCIKCVTGLNWTGDEPASFLQHCYPNFHIIFHCCYDMKWHLPGLIFTCD